MIEEVPMEWLVGINNFFKTNEVFSPAMVAIENDVNMGTMTTLQASLSSIGLLGYNLTDGNYFYRRLPFKPQRLISLNPRLQNAKKLTENNEVQIVEQRGDGVDRPLVDPQNPKTTNQEAGEPPDPTPTIPVDVAAQGVRAGTRIGYGMGTITGLGIGAAMAALLTRYRHRD